MKNIILFFSILLITVTSVAKSKMDIDIQIKVLTAKIETLSSEINLVKEQNKEIPVLKSKIADLDNEIQSLRQQQTSVGQAPKAEQIIPSSGGILNTCKAITSAGTQFSRFPDEGSEYCWQHKKTYEPNKSSNSS